MRPQDFGYGRLFGGMRDARIVADANVGRIVLWSNPSVKAILGYTSSEALGVNVEAPIRERLRVQNRASIARYRDVRRKTYIDSGTLLTLSVLSKPARRS